MKKIGKLTEEQFKEYEPDPASADTKMRKWFNIPSNRYYSVIISSSITNGDVWLDETRYRVAHVEKISKSNS